MACVETSDDRVGEVLLKRVMQEQLDEVLSSEVPVVVSTETQELESEQEQKMVLQLAVMIRTIGDAFKENRELDDVIDGMVGQMTSKPSYWKLVEKVFEDGQITWERIAVLFYVAGRIAVKVVIANLPELVKDILKWTLEYFRSKLLDWIQKHGGWMNSFAELARVQVERISSMSARSSGLILVFLGGVIMGSVITWKLVRRT
ncbi:apoptosis regulator BAX-like [Salvelinus alpinus]|uniref:Apoptosis regulator BAX-like isoform X2 n=1 Tax=Salvelinus namaycush TaxID=8040 RepID=A0A8U0R8Z8_SALNM|nr:apoptosis regulator BAX-like [Salvelinus alpinus]XP_038855694.1 apoptosis regulator BAX-like isoform X2 [Salvelinus namaycush]XP_055779560.1 apoptosis regulator BAX-like isoform X2 [Salvelinus fontinalis]